MKKLLLTMVSFTGLTFLAWVFSLASCNHVRYNVILKDAVLHTYKLPVSPQDTAGAVLLQPGASVSIDSCMFRFDISTYMYLVQRFQLPETGNTANATSIIRQEAYTHIDKINDVKIFTINDYSAAYPAGSDVTGICNFYYDELNTVFRPRDLNRILDEVYGAELINEFQLGIALRQQPDVDNAPQQFRTEITTDKGGILMDTTIIFSIKR